MNTLTTTQTQIAKEYYEHALADYAGRAEMLSSPTAITIQSIVDNARSFANRLPIPSGEASYIAGLEAKYSPEMFELRSEVLQTITDYSLDIRNLAETLLIEKHRGLLVKE